MAKEVIPFKKETDPTKSREVVRRNELTGIIKQIVENVNEMASHLLNDVNTLFKRFVYPNMMRVNAIENVLIAKGVLTKEEINAESKRITEEAIAKAKEIDAEGKLKESGTPGEGVKAEEVALVEKIEPQLETCEVEMEKTEAGLKE